MGDGQYIKDILDIKVGKRGKKLTLTYRTKPSALESLTRTVLGKRILFTDNHDWTTEEIILAYRSQHHVEAAFRQMKDSHCISWQPMHHWTDQKIRVHSFYCVLAFTLLCLLHRTACKAGVPVTVPALLDELSSIEEVVNLYASGKTGQRGRPRAVTTYSDTSQTAQKLSKLFHLDKLRVK